MNILNILIIKKEEIINENINTYKKLNKWSIDIINEISKKKELHKKLVGGDIDLYIQEHVEKKINYDILENGHKRVGKRSKYYHKYILGQSYTFLEWKKSKDNIWEWHKSDYNIYNLYKLAGFN